MISEIVHLDESTSEEEVLSELNRLNNDDTVSGILVQVPLPKQVSEQKVLETINPNKDVDGFHPINIGKLYIDEQTFVPCTPLGIMEILKHADINLEGKMQLLLVVVILLANLFQSYCCKLTQLLRFYIHVQKYECTLKTSRCDC